MQYYNQAKIAAGVKSAIAKGTVKREDLFITTKISPKQCTREAALAAVQEDIKLNKIIYKLVPKKLEESEFWRLYFSEVLFVLDSVKRHGQYQPPPPPPPADVAGGKKEAKKPVVPPPPPSESSCIIS